jgi:hypothetical protein
MIHWIFAFISSCTVNMNSASKPTHCVLPQFIERIGWRSCSAFEGMDQAMINIMIVENEGIDSMVQRTFLDNSAPSFRQ